MNYALVYEEFIADRRMREAGLVGYVERHHILPRSLGGGDGRANIIRLTPEDHFFAHILLARIHGGNMWAALVLMSRQPKQVGAGRGRRIRTMFGIIRRNLAESQTGIPRPDVAAYMRGRAVSAESRERMSRSATGRKASEETRRRISEGGKGRVFSDERNRKVAASKMGDLNPAKRADVRAKISANVNNTGIHNPRHDKTLRSFRHDDGRIETLTKFEMAKRHSLNRTCLNYVIAGVRPATKGWRLHDASGARDSLHHSILPNPRG